MVLSHEHPESALTLIDDPCSSPVRIRRDQLDEDYPEVVLGCIAWDGMRSPLRTDLPDDRPNRIIGRGAKGPVEIVPVRRIHYTLRRPEGPFWAIDRRPPVAPEFNYVLSGGWPQ